MPTQANPSKAVLIQIDSLRARTVALGFVQVALLWHVQGDRLCGSEKPADDFVVVGSVRFVPGDAEGTAARAFDGRFVGIV
jgi:hypothetical protein